MRSSVIMLAVMFAAAALACGSGAAGPVSAHPSSKDAAAPVRGRGAMREITATKFAADLQAAGLDVRDLPPLEKLDRGQKQRVMKTFSASLGVPCVGCHAEDDFKADTRRKRVAKRMYNEIVRVLALEDGAPVYCDSCHQGSMFTLDRGDKGKVSDFMSDVFVGKLKRVDGKSHDCDTCHGDPPDFQFLTAWKSSAAPDIELAAPRAAAQPPLVAAAPAAPHPAPVASSAAPVAPRKPKVLMPRPPPGECGEKNNLCPLQKWMRQNVAPAVASDDAAALAKALDKVATFSPDGSWQWAEISKAAAEAARRGDIAEARKSCQGCHNEYKAKWRASYRTRPVR